MVMIEKNSYQNKRIKIQN